MNEKSPSGSSESMLDWAGPERLLDRGISAGGDGEAVGRPWMLNDRC